MTGNIESLKEHVKSLAREQGFQWAGIATANEPPHFEGYLRWLAKGYAGEMTYLQRSLALRQDPRQLMPSAKSILVVGLNYAQPAGVEQQWEASDARFSIYALNDDYHDLIREKLKRILSDLQSQIPDCEGRVCVDSAPLMERDFAWQAGLGWFGKNTCLINSRFGSYFFIGALLLNLNLPPDSPAEGGCGSCRRCIDACPTGAIKLAEEGDHYELDARRCISYLTIELKEAVPEPLREGMGNWVYGCDVCQDVCPFNQPKPRQPERAMPTSEPRLQPRESLTKDADNLLERLLQMSPDDFRAMFKGSPVKRARWRGLIRNACVAAGNSQNPRYLPFLRRLLHDPDSLISEHARWAIQCIEQANTPQTRIESL